INNKKKQHFSEFKTNLAEQLYERVELRPKPSTGRSAHNPTRLHGKHFPMTIPATANKEFPSKRCCLFETWFEERSPHSV
ncbi:hypothetical protein J6590_105517, partial [Homalodisca vitripennis]